MLVGAFTTFRMAFAGFGYMPKGLAVITQIFCSSLYSYDQKYWSYRKSSSEKVISRSDLLEKSIFTVFKTLLSLLMTLRAFAPEKFSSKSVVSFTSVNSSA